MEEEIAELLREYEEDNQGFELPSDFLESKLGRATDYSDLEVIPEL